MASAWIKMTIIDFWPCRNDRAMLAARQAVDHARRSQDGYLLDEALLAFLMAQQGSSATPEEGLASLDELTGDVARSRRFEASDLAVRGLYRSWQGAFDEARDLVSRGIKIAEALGMGIEVAMFETILGVVEEEAQEPIAAERSYRRGYEIAEELGWEGYKTTPSGLLARMLVELGRLDEAESYASITRDDAGADDIGPQVMGRSTQAVVLAAQDRFDEAEQLAREAITMYAEAEDPNGQGTIRMDMAHVLRMAGKIDEAEEAARSALAFFERKGNRASSAWVGAFVEQLGGSTS